MLVAFLPGDPGLFDIVMALVLLIGLPLLVFAIAVLGAGYIQHDAEQYLEELEEEAALEAEGAGTRPLEDGDGVDQDDDSRSP